MTLNYLKDAGIAAIVLGCTIVLGCSLAVAQAAAPTPPPPNAKDLAALIKPRPDGTLPLSALKSPSSNPFGLGFNFEICKTLVWFSPDNGKTFFIVVANTDGSVILSQVPSLQTQFVAACQHADKPPLAPSVGYLVHVTNATPVSPAFDQVVIFYP